MRTSTRPSHGRFSGYTVGAMLLGMVCLLGETSADAAMRGVVMGRNGMAVSINPLASKVGINILEQGGNAVDAAIAMAAMLNVVDPTMTGIGGDAFMIVYSAKEGKVRALNASGRSPYGQTREFFIKKGFKKVPPFSIYAVNVPGALDGWDKLLTRYGTMKLADVLAPAIRYAEEGIPINESLHNWYRIPVKDPITIATYYINGRKPKLGDVLVQKNLAATFRKIARGGIDVFYKGEITEEIVRFSKDKGGFLSARDFADHTSNWVEPIRTTYRGLEVIGFPPNTQGMALLQQLNILEGFDLAAMGHNSADAIHIMIEAKKLAFADRNTFIADPEHTKIPLKQLLSKDYAKKRRALINMQRAAKDVAPGEPTIHNTTYFAVVDKEGNAVSFINSLRNPWGSRLVAGDTGILLQNRGRDFTLDPKHVNRYEPHRRSFHTIQPAMVLKDGKPYIVMGCSGGYQQTLGMVQVLTNVVDFGMNVQEAVEAPRWTHLKGPVMSIEHAIPASVRKSLSRRRHVIKSEYGRGVIWGVCQMIKIDPATGTYWGGSEPRASGAAIAY